MTEPNDKAFPSDYPKAYGLTKREWLAGIICAGLSTSQGLSVGPAQAGSNPEFFMDRISDNSVRQADSLIAALNRNPDEK